MKITIMGLSLWQSWASLMAAGAKKIETRSWPISYRGLVAIHAAKKWDDDLAEMAAGRRFREALFGSEESPKVPTATSAQIARSNGIHLAGLLPRGCFVALGKLRHCLSTTDHSKLIPPTTSDEYHFGDYSPGRFMWVFDEIWKLSSPVYARGHQGLWKLDERTVDVVLAMLPDGVEEQLLAEKGIENNGATVESSKQA